MGKKWMGPVPDKCQCGCEQPITEQFVDGRHQLGYWGIFRVTCYRECGVGYGLGRGQRYDAKTLEKVEG